MKCMFLPTLTEMREMLGEELYVKFVWMWRDQEQDVRAIERRAKFAALLPDAKIAEWPTPVFARAETQPAAPDSRKDRRENDDVRRLPTPAQALQAALLRAPVLADRVDVSHLEGFLERVGANHEEPQAREVAVAGGRRRRR